MNLSVDQCQDVNTAAQVRTLIRQGRKIEAVKLYRAATGVNLSEAADAVERMSADS